MNQAILRGMGAVAAILIALTQVGCGGGNGSGGSDADTGPGPQPARAPVATAVGTATGLAASAIVGPDGGSVTSPDGKATLTIPAGAVSTPTTITIQPITNQAHGGRGAALRLSPEGLQFAKPATLSFTYSDDDVAGSAAAALGIAFQRSSGVWEWAGAPVLDTAAKKVTVKTTHFSDWSLVQGVRLFPHQSTVGTGKTVPFKVVYCYPPEPIDDFLVPLGYKCEAQDSSEDLPPLTYVDEWSVDGVAGGNATKGTVAGNRFGATFTAPSSKPTPDTVAVSARVRNGSNAKTLVVAFVKITESADYSGKVNFEIPYARGEATVNWTRLGDVGGVAMYKASGTLQITTTVKGCDTTQLSFPIVSNDDISQGAYKMAVDPGGKYYFHLVANQPAIVTLMCGAAPHKFPMDFSIHSLTSVGIGTMSTGCPQPPVYSDRKQLAGSWSCPDSQTSATWTFNAP